MLQHIHFLVLIWLSTCIAANDEKATSQKRPIINLADLEFSDLYYSSYLPKLKETTSMGNCMIGKSRGSSPDSLVAKRLFGDSSLSSYDAYLMVSDEFCDLTEFTNYIDTFSYFPKQKVSFHPYHPKYDTVLAKTACKSSHKALSLRSVYSSAEFPAPSPNLASPFYVASGSTIVAMTGMSILPCGVWGYLASCGAASAVTSTKQIARSFGDESTVSRNIEALLTKNRSVIIDDILWTLPRYDRVLVLTQRFDHETGHFLSEILPRLVYFYSFLRKNKDVKIHLGFHRYANEVLADKFVRGYLVWLGLEKRIVSDTIIVDKTGYFPREGNCQDALYNAVELRATRKILVEKASAKVPMIRTWINRVPFQPSSRSILAKGLFSTFSYADKAPEGDVGEAMALDKASHFVVLIVMRMSKDVVGERNWRPDTLDRLQASLTDILFTKSPMKAIKNKDIWVFSDNDVDLMSCIPCQIAMFSQASVVIGLHGAGLANTIYMKPGGYVVEVVPVFDTRFLPVVGIFPRLSSTMGLNHFTYYPHFKDFETDAASVLRSNATAVQRNTFRLTNYVRKEQLETDDLVSSLLSFIRGTIRGKHQSKQGNKKKMKKDKRGLY